MVDERNVNCESDSNDICRYFASIQCSKAVPRYDHIIPEVDNAFNFNEVDEADIRKAITYTNQF